MVRGRPGLVAGDVNHALDLGPLPIKGGFYAEASFSARELPGDTRSAFDGSRSAATATDSFLTPDTISATHRPRGWGLASGGSFASLGTTMASVFDAAHFEIGNRAERSKR